MSKPQAGRLRRIWHARPPGGFFNAWLQHPAAFWIFCLRGARRYQGAVDIGFGRSSAIFQKRGPAIDDRAAIPILLRFVCPPDGRARQPLLHCGRCAAAASRPTSATADERPARQVSMQSRATFRKLIFHNMEKSHIFWTSTTAREVRRMKLATSGKSPDPDRLARHPEPCFHWF